MFLELYTLQNAGGLPRVAALRSAKVRQYQIQNSTEVMHQQIKLNSSKWQGPSLGWLPWTSTSGSKTNISLFYIIHAGAQNHCWGVSIYFDCDKEYVVIIDLYFDFK